MEQKVRDLLEASRAEDAITLLEGFRQGGGKMTDTLYYLQGNAWRKK